MSIRSRKIKKKTSSYRRMMGASSFGFGALDGVLEYNYRQSENPDESKTKSALFAAGTAAAWIVAPSLMFTKTGADLALGIGQGVRQSTQRLYDEKMNQLAPGQIGGGFQDTQMTYTQRQKGLAAMQQSRTNARSALGGEAKSLHRM